MTGSVCVVDVPDADGELFFSVPASLTDEELMLSVDSFNRVLAREYVHGKGATDEEH